MTDSVRTAGIPGRYRLALDWTTLVVVLALIALQAYRGLTAGSLGGSASIRNLGIALALLAGVGLSLTSAWRPELYLVGAIFVGTLTVFSGLRVPDAITFEGSRLLLGVLLFLLCLVQFFRAQLQFERDQETTGSDSTATDGSR